MKRAILKYSFPFIMLWNRRVLDFIREERQDTAFLVIRKRDNFHLEAAFERVALLFPHPKVRFGVIPVEGGAVSVSKAKILKMLGVDADSKLPAIYGLFFEARDPEYKALPGSKGGPPKKQQDDGQIASEASEVLDLLRKNALPKLKVVKCENMTERGIKSFLGSLNDLGGFAHCRQNQFINHKKNHKTLTFLNLDSLEKMLERAVHFERVILVYFSGKQDERSVLSQYSKIIHKVQPKSARRKKLKRRTRRPAASSKIQNKDSPGVKNADSSKVDSAKKADEQNKERQFYIFDKSRNDWPSASM